MANEPAHPRDAEAADYALGVGSLDERRAFKRDMARDPALSAAARAWAGRFSTLADRLPPVEPSAAVLHALGASLDTGSASNVVPFAASSQEVLRLRRSRTLWQGATAAAAALAAALALYIAVGPAGRVAAPSGLIAVVNRSGDLPALIVRVDPINGIVQVRSVSTEVPSGHSLELWSVRQGDSPKSLGVLGPDAIRRPVPAVAGQLTEGITLAVSVEPQGGSPTGAPTGPVVYSGKLVPEAP